jgi:hypothetical protein
LAAIVEHRAGHDVIRLICGCHPRHDAVEN